MRENTAVTEAEDVQFPENGDYRQYTRSVRQLAEHLKKAAPDKLPKPQMLSTLPEGAELPPILSNTRNPDIIAAYLDDLAASAPIPPEKSKEVESAWTTLQNYAEYIKASQKTEEGKGILPIIQSYLNGLKEGKGDINKPKELSSVSAEEIQNLLNVVTAYLSVYTDYKAELDKYNPRAAARPYLIERMANMIYTGRQRESSAIQEEDHFPQDGDYSGYKGEARKLADHLQKHPMPQPKLHNDGLAGSGLNIPNYVNCTGDVGIISDYLDADPLDSTGKPLSDAARQYLIERMANVIYVNQQAEKFKNKKYEPLSAKRLGENGYLLQGIHQPERQDTAHCCWTMPAKLMLQSRGIHLDQETIRCYNPELSAENLNYGKNLPHPDIVRDYTEDVDGVFDNLSGLLHKFVPNCAIVHSTFNPNRESQEKRNLQKEEFKKEVTAALSEHRTPIALLTDRHYRTIVGIEGDDLIVKDSRSIHRPDTNLKVPISSLFTAAGGMFTIDYMRDLTVTRGSVLPQELDHFKDVLEVSDPAEGKTSLSVKPIPEELQPSPTPAKPMISKIYEVQIGSNPVLECISCYDKDPALRSNRKWILPEKLNENVITLQFPQEYVKEDELSETPSVLYDKARVASAKSFAVADLIAQESSFLADLPSDSFLHIMDMANDARQELNVGCMGEDRERCMRTLLFAKSVEAERALGGGKPGNLEKVFAQGLQNIRNAQDTENWEKNTIYSDTVTKLYEQCPDPKGMTHPEIEDFLLNDTAGKIVRDTLIRRLESKKSPASLKAKVINATDPLHETKRLELLYQRLRDADPALMISSEQFRTMRKSLETLMELRAKYTEVRDESVNAEQRRNDMAELSSAYKNLKQAAIDYMNIKNPALLKEGTTAKKRYDVANALLDFSDEMHLSYQKENAKLPPKPHAAAPQAKAAKAQKAAANGS